MGVATTAYNWLPLYRSKTSQSPTTLRLLKFSNEQTADWAYAVIASDLVYWLWRVEGDGFHLPTAFLARLPITWSGQPADEGLAELGRALWASALRRPIRSVNGGRETFSYPGRDAPIQAAIAQGPEF